MRRAVELHITGVVQGVGFRPFVFRLARQNGIGGWVRNDADGVHVLAEAGDDAVARFVQAVRDTPPPAARVATFAITPAAVTGRFAFEICESAGGAVPTARISPDLAVCDECLRELFDPADRRYGYPYINCTNCGPRYSIVLDLPYDRPRTTMRDWPMCAQCRVEYNDPGDRRFHAQPIACPACGPSYWLEEAGATNAGTAAIARAAALLAGGAIVAVKGIGGYHLACDAFGVATVEALRARKFRKERAFAVMVRELSDARALIDVDAAGEAALLSVERPIVLAPARRDVPWIAPHNRDLGVMLAYAPLHHLLFAHGAPRALVMTSANRSSEPIAYRDDDARAQLAGIADALLIGERPIARRVDDSVVRPARGANAVLRRSRGLAPQAVAMLPATGPILAVGGDLKNAVTLVVGGQAFASQHIGDLDHLAVQDALAATVRDLCAVYAVEASDLTIVHDAHPGYHSTAFAQTLAEECIAVQHHRAHVASVLAERGAWEIPVLGLAFDGTGYGDDGTIWGGEVFSGTLAGGLERVAHLRPASLPGGDAAARFPVQAAAGFVHASGFADAVFLRPPFSFPVRYAQARQLVDRGVRTFSTTSIGRLFDTVAALAGFTNEQTYEGQAAMWLEHAARACGPVAPYPFPFSHGELDYRPLLAAIVDDRLRGRPVGEIARAFHGAVAGGVLAVVATFALERIVASGGVFQNALLCEMLIAELGDRLWLNAAVPPSDGGLSLGQAAIAALGTFGARTIRNALGTRNSPPPETAVDR